MKLKVTNNRGKHQNKRKSDAKGEGIWSKKIRTTRDAAERAAFINELESILTPQDRKEMDQEMGILLAIVIPFGVFMCCLIAWICLTSVDIVPADKMRAQLKPANCTLNNAQKPYQGTCKITPLKHEPCVVVALNFTVTQHNKIWIKQFDETWPLSEALNIANNFDTLFVRGTVYACYTDGTDLEIYIPDVESKRKSANILLIVTMVIFFAMVSVTFTVVIYVLYKQRTDPTFELQACSI